jgi:hypothetical protein
MSQTIKITSLLIAFCIEKKLPLVFSKKNLPSCSKFLSDKKYSAFVIINEKHEDDLMVRDIHNCVVQGMARENAPKECFYCQFYVRIESGDIINLIVIEDNKVGYVFSKETLLVPEGKLRCPDSDWDD